MARHGTLSRRPAKGQPPADMRDDKTANTTADHTHIPLPSLAPSIPCPASDRCATAVPVGTASRRSSPAISRFCPVLGWRTMLQLLARRAAESNAFSVPDRNALWSGAEDDLLVRAVAKNSTSDVLGLDWRVVAWDLPRRTAQQCKECYRLAQSVVELTFVFLRVIFRSSPSLRSSHVLTKVTDSADSARPLHYSTFDASPSSPAPSPSPPSSLTHVHRDGVSEHAASPSPPSSLTHVHRCIGSRNTARQTLPTSAKLTHLSVYDSRDGVSEHVASPSPPSSLMHVHRCIGSRNATRQTLHNPADAAYLCEIDVSKCV